MDTPRRSRGMFSLVVTGAVALSALATSVVVVGLATGVVPASVIGTREVIAIAVRGLLVGGLAGGVFGALLSYRERHRTISTLSSKRMALWGFVAGATAPTLVALTAAGGGALPLSLLSAGAVAWGLGGALAGVGLLRMARRASPELLSATHVDALHADTNKLLR